MTTGRKNAFIRRLVFAAAATAGDLLSETAAKTETLVVDGVFAAAKAQSAGLAVSVFFPAASASASAAAAALP